MSRPRNPDFVRITVTQMHGRRVTKHPVSITFDVTDDIDFDTTIKQVYEMVNVRLKLRKFLDRPTVSEVEPGEPEGGEN